MKSLKVITIKNISYTAVGKVVSFISQSIANIILSRELGADDYGIAGFAMIFVSLFSRLGNFGINTAFIQKKNTTENGVFTAFYLKSIISIVAYAVLYILSAYIPMYFNYSGITNVVRIAALVIIINNFAFVPSTMLARSLNFKLISILDTVQVVSGSIVGIVLALNGFKYYSIIYSLVISNIVYAVIINYIKPINIKFVFNKELANELLQFGSKVILTMLLGFAVTNIDNLLVGSIAGSTQLGYYSIAFNWGAMVCAIMGGVILDVLFPTLSKIQDNNDRLGAAYLNVLKHSTFAAVVFNSILFCISDDFFVYILGKGTTKWVPAILIVKIFSIYGIIRAFTDPINSILMAKGRMDLLLKTSFVAALLEIVFICVAVRFFGIVGVAASVVSVCLLQMVFLNSQLLNIIEIKSKDLLIEFVKIAGAYLITIALYSVSIAKMNAGYMRLGVGALAGFVLVLIAYGLIDKCKLYKGFVNLLNQLKAA